MAHIPQHTLRLRHRRLARHSVCSQDFLYGDKMDDNPTPQGDIDVSFGSVDPHTAHELGIVRLHTVHKLDILRSKSISTSVD